MVTALNSHLCNSDRDTVIHRKVDEQWLEEIITDSRDHAKIPRLLVMLEDTYWFSSTAHMEFLAGADPTDLQV